MDMEFINILAGMDRERAEKHSKKYLDLMLQHGWKKGGDRIVKLEYTRWAQEEAVKESYKHLEDVVKVKDSDCMSITSLEDSFEKILISDLIEFYKNYKNNLNFTKTPFETIILSETFRTYEDQAKILTDAWQAGYSFLEKYMKGKIKTEIFKLMLDAKDGRYREETAESLEKRGFNKELSALLAPFVQNPKEGTAYDVFLEITKDTKYGIDYTSRHTIGKAVDFSGVQNSHEMKKQLVEFLGFKKSYTINIYHKNLGPIVYKIKGRSPSKIIDWIELKTSYEKTWFFHIQ